MAYCQPEDVAAFVSDATPENTTTAIAIATDLINDFTGDRFSTSTAAVQAVATRNGVASLPITARTVTTVALADTGEALPAWSWTFQAGRFATVRVTAQLPHNILITGREPWADRRLPANTRLTISGTFGYATTPEAVRQATALLAARHLASLGQGKLTDAGSTALGTDSNITSMSVEGFSVTYRDQGAEATTGTPTVDRLLAPYRRASRPRWS